MNAIVIATFIMRKLFNSSNDKESKEKKPRINLGRETELLTILFKDYKKYTMLNI